MSALDAEGWILAGGRSMRMGRDKAGVEIARVPLLEHMLGKLRDLGLRARVAGMRESVDGMTAEIVNDLHPNCGPLSGMETALIASEMSLILILGVDMPLIETHFLQWMLTRAQASGAIATIPKVLGEPQPLCVVCRRELLGSVSRSIESGDYKVTAAIENAGTEGRPDFFDAERAVATGAWESSLPVYRQFINCNRREDVALAEALLVRNPML